MFTIQDKLRRNPELFFEKRVPQKSSLFVDGKSIISQIREEDKLLSFPYESHPALPEPPHGGSRGSGGGFHQGPTLYRLAKQSKVVEALIEAAENGKEVAGPVDFRARFDEENNIEWSRRPEEAGCQVIYGLDGYKVHSKLCLITRKSGDGVELYQPDRYGKL